MEDVKNLKSNTENAREIYARWLREGQASSFADLCQTNPRLVNQLQELHELARLARSVAFQPVVRDLFGEEADLRLTIEEESADQDTLVEAPASSPVRQGVSNRRYQVQGEVARGGMGVIYKVRDNELNRTLAMKVMLHEAGTPQSQQTATQLARFMEEVQLTAQLDHPGIVSVHELGVDGGGRPFFTMKLVKGRELSKIFELAVAEQEGWNLPRAVGALVKACQAVAFAHSKGVIHRDLKPANIMVGRFGEVYVMDWGLAKVTGRPDTRDLRLAVPAETFTRIQSPRLGADSSRPDSPLITMDGSVVGTPAFMPPEQAQGRIEEVDAQSDVYSLGAILYTLLAGHSPYVGRGARLSPHTILAMVLQGPPKPLESINSKAPPELVAICGKAMMREKPGRYASCIDLAEDLQAWLDRRVVKAYRTGPAAELKSWVRRNRLAAGVALAGLALLLALGGVWNYREHLNSLRLREQLARQYLRHGQALCERRRVNEGLHWFLRALDECPDRAAALRDDVAANVSGWSKRCHKLVQMFEHESAPIKGAHGRRIGLSFSQDGTRLVTAGAIDRSARLWSVATGNQIGKEMKHADSVGFATILSSGQIVSGDRGGRVHVWTEQGEPLFPALVTNVFAFSVEHTDSTIAAGLNDGTVAFYDARSGQPQGSISTVPTGVGFVTFSDDGEKLFAGWWDHSVRIWSRSARKVIRTFENLPGRLVAVSGNGRKFAVMGEDRTVHLWSVESGSRLGEPIAFSQFAFTAFSPDGSILVLSDNSATRMLSTATGAIQTLLRRHNFSLSYTPDSRYLLGGSQDFNATLFALPSGAQVGNTIVRDGNLWDVSFRPGFSGPGKLEFALAMAGRAELWSAGLPEENSTELPSTPTTWAIDFHPTKGEVVAGNWNGSLKTMTFDGEISVDYPNASVIWDARYAPDGQALLASLGENEVGLFRADSAKRLATIKADGVVRSLALNRAGGMAATGSFKNVAQLWSLPAGEFLAHFDHPNMVEDLDFTSDGKTLVTACGDGKVRAWSLQNKHQAVAPAEHANSVLALEVSPNGALIATGSRDQTARFWNARTLEPVGILLEHANWVEDVAFSPDGKILATACADGNVQLWSVESGERLGPPMPHPGPAQTVRFSPDGTRLLVAVHGYNATLWTLPKAGPLETADLRKWIEASTGLRMEPNGVLSLLSPAEWRAAAKQAQHF